ncbi:MULTISPECIES: outer membrane beta-barrel protein [unclassified Yoonia]|uniref:outer membrane beta-barrel protein n=1 Tax=unclassified Yoonia TaxID=2629118 RepID=UPI002AFFF97C|nr:MULTISPECIES: outer membrane beta-barrel protein [unclassified Yoonia]
MKHLAFSAACLLTLSTQAAWSQSFSYEFYLGAAIDLTADGLEYTDVDYPLDNGSAFGLGAYTDQFGGVELGLDLMVTDRRYTDFESGLKSVSLMAMGRYPVARFATGDAYVGAGLGAIRVEYDGADFAPAFTGDEITAGGQISLGTRFGLGTGQGFVEFKYQTAFDTVEIVGETIEYNTSALVVGYRF